MPEAVSGLWLVGPALYFVMAGSVLCVMVILFVATVGDKNCRNTGEHHGSHSPAQR